MNIIVDCVDGVQVGKRKYKVSTYAMQKVNAMNIEIGYIRYRLMTQRRAKKKYGIEIED